MQKTVFRLILIALGCFFGLLATEIGLRLYYPDGGIPAVHLLEASDEKHSMIVEDPECGYLPVVGRGDYGPNGCLANDYDLDNKSGRRVLFIGDSVTRRARIVKPLTELYAGKEYEFWNAGVESFNTKQEVVFYRRYNQKIKPDHVVLTFHNNDFRVTPLVMREAGQIRIFEPTMHMNQWLFARSHLYRWAWPKLEDKEERALQVRQSLEELKELTADIRLSVVLHPMLKPLEDWDDKEKRSRELSLKYFDELGLTYYDLLPVLEQAIADKTDLLEQAGDFLHPGDALGQRFAHYLFEQGLLEEK